MRLLALYYDVPMHLITTDNTEIIENWTKLSMKIDNKYHSVKVDDKYVYYSRTENWKEYWVKVKKKKLLPTKRIIRLSSDARYDGMDRIDELKFIVHHLPIYINSLQPTKPTND